MFELKLINRKYIKQIDKSSVCFDITDVVKLKIDEEDGVSTKVKVIPLLKRKEEYSKLLKDEEYVIGFLYKGDDGKYLYIKNKDFYKIEKCNAVEIVGGIGI